ncbi:hypothetical protein DBR17_17735, partial [Sphingomonas sp. HMWF008]
MKLSLIIEAIVRGKAPLEGVTKSVKALDRASDAAARGGLSRTGRAIDRADRSATGLARSAERMGFAIGAGARRGVLGLVALERRLTISRAGMGRLAEMAGGVAGRGLAVGATAAGAGVLGAVYKIVTAGMMFEKLKAQLDGAMGSPEGSKRAFDYITKFAADTPYTLDVVAEAFIDAKNKGLEPFSDTLRTLGDAGSALNKTYTQSIDMMTDAMNGEFSRLPEYGIKASQKGGQVMLRYVTKDGKQAIKQVRKDAFAIRDAILAILGSKFDGGMARVSKTTEGKITNIGDRLTALSARIWEKGLRSSVNKQLDRFSAWVDGLESNGNLAKWAESTGKGLGDLVTEAGKLDWQQFGKDIADVAGAIHSAAVAIRELSDTKTGIAGFLNNVQGGVNSAGAATNRWLRGLASGGDSWNRFSKDPLGSLGLGRSLGIDPGEK